MKTIRDPLWQNIELDEDLYEILSTPEFQRLNDIKQLGPTYRVYPGATHSRFSHSIGVYHIATLLINKLYGKGAHWLTPEGIKSFQIAALCHDLGHFPFTHALKELPLKDHEVLTGEILQNSKIAEIIKNSGLDEKFVAAIIDTEIPTQNEEILFYRKILSGVLDPDKLDYLNRDAFFCGVPYGIQDTDYTLSCINPDREHGIAINSKSIVAVENLLFSKYLMYRTVYWHKDVRIATAMMKKTLFSALSANEIQGEDLYNLTDAELFAIVDRQNDDKIWYPAKQLNQNNLYEVLLEIPFDESDASHKKLETLSIRTQKEKEIASILNAEDYQVLIDIPENISFESNLWICDDCKILKNSNTVFSENTIKSFTKNLRYIKILLDRKFLSDKTEKDITSLTNEILEIIKRG